MNEQQPLGEATGKIAGREDIVFAVPEADVQALR